MRLCVCAASIVSVCCVSAVTGTWQGPTIPMHAATRLPHTLMVAAVEVCLLSCVVSQLLCKAAQADHCLRQTFMLQLVKVGPQQRTSGHSIPPSQHCFTQWDCLLMASRTHACFVAGVYCPYMMPHGCPPKHARIPFAHNYTTCTTTLCPRKVHNHSRAPHTGGQDIHRETRGS